MQNLVKEILNQENYAVAGSFRNESKVAWRILGTLGERGRKVYALNPKIDKVGAIQCYRTVKDIPFRVDVVVIVTPPQVTLKIVKDCKDININYIWIQPGAESEEVIKCCKMNNIKVIYGMCIILNNV